MGKRVVVTGLGVVAPNGIGLAAFRQALEDGRSGVRLDQKLFDLDFSCQVAGIPPLELACLQARFRAEQLRAMNSCMKFAGLAATECWTDAGLAWSRDTMDGPTDWGTGTIFGNGIGGMDTIGDQVVPMTTSGSVRRLGSTVAEQVMSSNVSALIGGLFGLGNHVSTNSSACATGTESVVTAFRHIRAGYATRMLAGSAEGYSPYTSACFDAMRVTSRGWNANPERASRPLSASSSGFVPAAGAGALMLEDLDSARKRGARIYAEVLGGHVNCGGQRTGGSITASNPEGAQRCIRAALDDAGINGRDISYVNGHLTATRADANEIQNLSAALGVKMAELPLINSTKSMIGHALGAAGSIECVATVLQLYHSFVHPSINCEDLNPRLAAIENQVPTRCQSLQMSYAMKTSFGFGDVNACVVLGPYYE